ncbi:hypothetical protein CALVIDRAFT_257402 [Calocera viscosa TUFC12733]|uniref:BHLH domain-containing protein n=1 Tax=Calocera viscosa (strain TUFC12733) TaxID=1330018 RepID=A0A167JA70_CALVF|nr:hypothetical protein CALVIDRAFT_257402 [Calocera viscosa TUFC12733]
MSHAHPPSRAPGNTSNMQGPTAAAAARRSSIFNILESDPPPSPRSPTMPRTLGARPSYPYSALQFPAQPTHYPPHPHPPPHPGSRTNPILLPSAPPSPSPPPPHPHVHPALQPFSPDQLPPNPFTSPRRRARKTAEKRALHNEIERRRRCNLNESVLTLGRLIPSLASIHRPSQNQILTSTLAYVQQQQQDQQIVARELAALAREATALREEVNDWRGRAGRPLVEAQTRSDDFLRLVSATAVRPGPRLEIPGEDRQGDEDDEESEMDSESPETDQRVSGRSSRS